MTGEKVSSRFTLPLKVSSLCTREGQTDLSLQGSSEVALAWDTEPALRINDYPYANHSGTLNVVTSVYGEDRRIMPTLEVVTLNTQGPSCLNCVEDF